MPHARKSLQKPEGVGSPPYVYCGQPLAGKFPPAPSNAGGAAYVKIKFSRSSPFVKGRPVLHKSHGADKQATRSSQGLRLLGVQLYSCVEAERVSYCQHRMSKSSIAPAFTATFT